MPDEKMHVPGYGDVEVISESDLAAETHKAVGCLLADQESAFPDNVIAECAECGRDVQHRPYWNDVPNVKFICMDCVPDAMAKTKDARVGVTPRVRDEVQSWIRKKSN